MPTTEEAGLPQFQSIAWTGLFVPAGTPQNIVEKLHDDVVKAINSPEEQADALRLGTELAGSTPAEFRQFIRAEMDKWGKVVKISGARVD